MTQTERALHLTYKSKSKYSWSSPT